jgi:hypothetical protein
MIHSEGAFYSILDPGWSHHHFFGVRYQIYPASYCLPYMVQRSPKLPSLTNHSIIVIEEPT